jgi:hypothetical protein
MTCHSVVDYVGVLRFAAIPRRWLLHRILQRRCSAFCSAGGSVEVFVGRLGIMLETHLGVMAHPQGNDVNRQFRKQFRLAA